MLECSEQYESAMPYHQYEYSDPSTCEDGSYFDSQGAFSAASSAESPPVIRCEDEDALAFLDILPRAPGHTLVVPKVHARYLHHLAPHEAGRLYSAVNKVATAVYVCGEPWAMRPLTELFLNSWLDSTVCTPCRRLISRVMPVHRRRRYKS